MNANDEFNPGEFMGAEYWDSESYAFPVPLDAEHPGMTLKDYFAAKAMQAMIANPSWFGSRRWDTQEEMAEDYADEAYLFAAAMINMSNQG
jgi:hypothetical protein